MNQLQHFFHFFRIFRINYRGGVHITITDMAIVNYLDTVLIAQCSYSPQGIRNFGQGNTDILTSKYAASIFPYPGRSSGGYTSTFPKLGHAFDLSRPLHITSPFTCYFFNYLAFIFYWRRIAIYLK